MGRFTYLGTGKITIIIKYSMQTLGGQRIYGTSLLLVRTSGSYKLCCSPNKTDLLSNLTES